MDVEYKFEVGQEVLEPATGKKGVVKTLNCDDDMVKWVGVEFPPEAEGGEPEVKNLIEDELEAISGDES